MNTNKDDEYQLIIYTILLNKNDSFITYWFGINREQGLEHMNKIAELGGTKKVYEERTSSELETAFCKIAKAITPKFGLKIK